MLNLNDAREFVRILSGKENSLETFQVFYDPKPPLPQHPELAATFTNTLDGSLDFFNDRQSRHCGVYMCINGTDGVGRNNENINNLRVCFADFDGRAEPTWAITPHLIQKRDDTHGHAFWLIESSDITHDEWSGLQLQIALYYDTDKQVIDPARVARLPSFTHYKNPLTPAKYSITSNNSTLPKYTHEQIRMSCLLDATKDAELRKWFDRCDGLQTGTGFERSDVYETRYKSWASTVAPIAVEGSGTMTLIKVASWGHDYGIPVDITKEILWDNYNERCEPPWLDNERGHFNEVIDRAYKYATSVAGCKTALASFGSLPALPAPINGWDDNAKVNEPVTIKLAPNDTAVAVDRIGSSTATTILATLTGKSSHYEFAQCFDGRVYDGERLIRSRKQFYTFNGRCWQPIDDDVIKAQIQRMCKVFKPADSFTSGVFKTLCDLVNVSSVDNGIWLDGRDSNTDNLAVFNNGIVDLNSTDRKIINHTHEYFTFNEMGYNFNEKAKCPNWIKFLDSIFDKQLQLQLQQWFGYCLTNDVSLQKWALFIGASRAGKGVVTDVLSKMVGLSNVVSPALPNIVKDSTLHSMATASLAVIPDAHNVHINTRDAVLSNLKAITGEDPMTYHVMYKGAQTSHFKTRIVMSTNNMPDFIDSSGALVNRMLVFPFSKSFIGKENSNLRKELLAEIEGVAQWAVNGLISLRNSNNIFTEAPKGNEIKQEIREDMFPLADFVKQMCVVEGNEFVKLNDIYSSYRLWCSSNGIHKPMTQINVAKCLRNSPLDITHVVPDGIRGFTGLVVKKLPLMNNVTQFQSVAS